MNAPKLRFKEFNDEWKNKNLSELVSFSKGNLLSKSDLDENGVYPCILYGQLYTTYHEVIRKVYYKTNNNSKNITRSKYGDILIPSSGETPIDISTSSCLLLDNILLGGDINILSPINCDGRFISYMINNNKRTEIAKVAQGHSIVHLYNENLKKVNLQIPTMNEQIKVANTLELLDKKIEFQTKKIEDLKLFKLCITEKIFNSSKAKISIKLKNISLIEKGEQINNDQLLNYGDYYMLNGGINPSGYLNIYNRNENTITVSEGGNSCGYVSFNRKKFWCGGHCYSIKPFNINNEYLYQLLKYNERKIMYLRVGSGLPNIQKKDLENLIVRIHNDNEQKRISILLLNYDNKIYLESKKLNILTQLKKGLMQSMFV